MGRLIDADKLLETLQDLELHCENKDYEYGMLNTMRYYMPEIINDEPTAYDADKVVEKLEGRSDFLKECTKYGNNNAEQQEKSYSTMMMYEVADLVDDLIEIVKHEAEQYNNGWIPCSERLPEDKQTCLVTARIYFTPDHVDEIDNYIGVGIDTYSKQFGWLGTETIAWQPLPAPYQPKGE